MAVFSKRIAVLALAAAAGCADSFPPVPGPLDRFYYPVGMAVRRLPGGTTALLVVSTNFDQRYDYKIGGAVLAVDPDASGNALAGDPTLAVLGGLNIGTYGGEIDYLAGGPIANVWDPNYDPGQQDCAANSTCVPDEIVHACQPLASRLSPGAAKVVVASRGTQLVYLLDMDAQGRLACNGCTRTVLTQALDPYDVAATCSNPGAGQVARAYLTHLRSPGNEGLLTELDLLLGTTSTLYMGSYSTSSATFERATGRIFVSAQFPNISLVPLRWFNAITLPPDGVPAIQAHNVAADVHGALTRELALYPADPATPAAIGYLRLELFDYDLAAKTGSFVATGGGLAVYDMTPGPQGQPSMRLLKVVPICTGTGHVRVLPMPPQPPPPAPQRSRPVVALTCTADGTLQFYDDEVGATVASISLDPGTGTPVLGRSPFGLVVEEREAGRCLPGPGFPGPCTRLYVSSFDSSWVNIVELDVANPGAAAIVKRIGRERD